MAVNFHGQPFSEETKAKLGLFRDYTMEWLPVWLTKGWKGEAITICDFFAGPGTDLAGVPGSPLIVLDVLQSYQDLIRSTNANVRLVFNEADKAKAAELNRALESAQIPPSLCQIAVLNLDFDVAFSQIYQSLMDGPNLLILDQQGMKAISDKLFLQLLELPRTDFLFFIASSSIRRFEGHEYFQRYLQIPPGEITGAAFNDTHRAVTQYYRRLASEHGSTYYLGSFSIKKRGNIYGLIFGSRSPLGMEKFLKACWKEDPQRGESNFDIDDDRINPRAPTLFDEMNRPSKRTKFEDSLIESILNGDLRTDSDVYVRTLQEGFLPIDGRLVLQSLIKERRVRVHCGRQPRVSWKGFRDPRTLEVDDPP